MSSAKRSTLVALHKVIESINNIDKIKNRASRAKIMRCLSRVLMKVYCHFSLTEPVLSAGCDNDTYISVLAPLTTRVLEPSCLLCLRIYFIMAVVSVQLPKIVSVSQHRGVRSIPYVPSSFYGDCHHPPCITGKGARVIGD